MLSLAICDDDPAFAQWLGGLVQRVFAPDVTISTYRSGLELLHDFQSSLAAIDVLLMDIRMPILDGIEACIRIREKDTLMPIIFLTNHAEEMPRCFEANPYHFLAKEFDEGCLISVIGKAISLARLLRPQHRLLVETRQMSCYVPTGEILYMESMGRKLHIHLQDETYTINGKISEMARQLSGYGFVLVHRCILVNLYAVKHIDYADRMIHLRDGRQVVLSSDRTRDVKYAQHQMLRLKIHG